MITIQFTSTKRWADKRFDSVFMPGGDLLHMREKPRWTNNTLRYGVYISRKAGQVTPAQFDKMAMLYDDMASNRRFKYVELSPDLAELSPYYPHAIAWLSVPNVGLRKPTECHYYDRHTV